MKVRRRGVHGIAYAIGLITVVILTSGCASTGGSAGPSAPIVPPSTVASPVPAGLYVDPPTPGVASSAVMQPSPLPEPPARAPFLDPAFGTRLVRVTDRAADLLAGDRSQGLGNEHSRVQAFNADGSRLLIRGTEATWYLYNATTLLPEGRLPFDGAVDPRWDASDPDVLYYVDGPRLMRYDIGARERELVHDFSGAFSGHSPAHVWTRYEGSPSRDGRYWGLMGQGAGGKVFAFLVYDAVEDRIVARRDVPPTQGVNSVTISPLGDYFLAYWEPRPDGRMGSDASPGGLMVYDRDLKNGRGLVRTIGPSDLALDAQGREVVVYRDDDNGTIAACDLATGKVTDLCPIDPGQATAGIHISGRAFANPGWAVVSTYDNDPIARAPLDNEVFALELKPGGRIVRLAHTRSSVDPAGEQGDRAGPQATVNSDFTRVLFTSNRGQSGAAVDTYMIVLPAGWTDRL